MAIINTEFHYSYTDQLKILTWPGCRPLHGKISSLVQYSIDWNQIWSVTFPIVGTWNTLNQANCIKLSAIYSDPMTLLL